MKSDRATSFARSPEALSRRVGIDVLVTTPGDPEVHELSGGAAAVWDALDAPLTLEALVERLADRHEAAPEAIAPEVDGCLRTLEAIGVVRSEASDG
jgi:hypothetical protein